MTEIRLRMVYNSELGKWITIWPEEVKDILFGSEQAVGVELMGKGTYKIESDNDRLEYWLTLQLDKLLKCPKCGFDGILGTVNNLFKCKECEHIFDKDDAEEAETIRDADEMVDKKSDPDRFKGLDAALRVLKGKDKIECPRCKSENTDYKERTYTDEEEVADSVVDHCWCNECKYTWDVVK